MLIGGYQKVSLIDFPGVVASIIFTRGCNFMCPYCHNPELLQREGVVIPEEEIFSVLLENKKMIDGVVVTGGEPCLHPDLPEFLSKLKDMGFKIKLDSNGSVPALLKKIFDAKLVDYVAMDIKAPWGKYHLIARPADAAERVKESLAIIENSGVPHEFRTTIFPGVHTMDDFIEMAGYLKDGNKYFIQDIRRKKTLSEITAETDLYSNIIAAELEKRFPKLQIGHR